MTRHFALICMIAMANLTCLGSQHGANASAWQETEEGRTFKAWSEATDATEKTEIACRILRNWPASTSAEVVAFNHICDDRFPAETRCTVAKLYLEVYEKIEAAVLAEPDPSYRRLSPQSWDYRREAFHVLYTLEENEGLRDYYWKLYCATYQCQPSDSP